MSLKYSRLAIPALTLLMLTGCTDDTNKVVVPPTSEVTPNPGPGPGVKPEEPELEVTPELEVPDPEVKPLPESLSQQCDLVGGSLTCQQPVTSLASLAEIDGLTAVSLTGLTQQQMESLPVLPNVTTLQLSNSTLSSMDLLNTFPKLTTLGLDSFTVTPSVSSSNRASLSLMDQLTRMTQLESLSITNSDALINQFTSFAFLGQLSNLHTLDLSGNTSLFSGSAETVQPLFAAIGKMGKLKSLLLENTGLSGDDNAPLQLSLTGKDLTTLRLAYNGYNGGSLFSSQGNRLLTTIIEMANLKTLTVSGLNWNAHSAFSLAHWPKLQTLGLVSSPSLLSLHPTLKNDTLSRSWQGLDLSGNQLTLNADSLAKLQPETLRVLRLSGNTLLQDANSDGKTVVELIASFTNLEELDLSRMQLTGLTFGVMPSLHTLDLSNNRLTDFTLSEDQMPVLETLNLASNQLKTFATGTMPALQSLDLRFGKFTELTFSEGQMPALRLLDLSFSDQLTQLSRLSFPSLETLNATNTLLTSFTAGDLPALKILDLSNGTQLASFTSNGLPALEVLDLEYNLLTKFDASNMPALYNLRLRRNQLTSFTTTGNPSLEVLHLGWNNLTAFSSAPLPKLQSLVLEKNKLTSLTISEGQFPEMTTLKLSSNGALSSLTLSEDQVTNGITVEVMATALNKEQLQAEYPTITFN